MSNEVWPLGIIICFGSYDDFFSVSLQLDCGILPSHQGEESLPFLREIEDPSQIDIIFITYVDDDHHR